MVPEKNVKPSGKTKQCELCAEDIPLEAARCPYCPAVYTIVIQGYCKQCHAVRAANLEGVCSQCGSNVEDLQVLSKFTGDQLIAKPASVKQPVPAAPPVAERYMPPQTGMTPPGKLQAELAGMPKGGRRLPRWAWALIAFGIVLCIGAIAGAAVWLTRGQGPEVEYGDWRVRFSEDFTETFRAWLNFSWSEASSSGTMKVDEGEYHMHALAGLDTVVFSEIPYLYSLGDFYLAADLKQIGGSQGGSDPSSIGIAFHTTPPSNSAYVFEVRTNGTASLGLVQDGEYQVLNSPLELPTYQKGEFNRVVVVYDKGIIKAYVNGSLIVERQDDTLPTGYLGFQGWLQYIGDSADFYFDNLEIRIP